MARIDRPFVIFAVIGVFNTLVDASIFVTLHSVGVGILIANTLSTSAAIIVSFLLNSRFTFTHSGGITKEKLLKFIGITLTGQWLLQPAIIFIVLAAMNATGLADLLMGLANDWDSLPALIAKMFAIPATLVWNYYLYRRVVFIK